MLNSLRKTYNDFPFLFWIVVVTLFIDSIGSTLLFPFFALYITERFNVGMTQAGILIGISSLFGLVGSVIGGVITDRFGRRRLILFGLIFSAVSSLLFGLAADVDLLYILVVVVGLLSRIATPAHDAMMADILPESKRQEGFGITRVAFNYAWIFGTALGGLIASRSFLALFVIDSLLSIAVAIVLFVYLPETKPTSTAGEHSHETILQTITGYRSVLRDGAYMCFILAGMIVMIVYQQQYSSLPVYLREVHHIGTRLYGIMLAISGFEVVLFQIRISRITRRFPPFVMMTVAAVTFMIGFMMMGLIRGPLLFILAITIATIGEMIMFPVNKALAANFSPIAMRGRYMAIYDLGWTIPATIGPAAAGLILDYHNPNSLWYIGGALCAIAAISFRVMHLRLGSQSRFAPIRD